MSGILSAILCWLDEWFPSFNDYFVNVWDGLLTVVDTLLAAIAPVFVTLPTIDPAYTWLLGATGVAPALALMATAMTTRFLLQSIPFVRWGS